MKSCVTMAQAPDPVPQPMVDVVSALLNQTLTLVEISSVSGDEKKIADYIEAQLKPIDSFNTTRLENNLVARTDFVRDKRLLICGHTDTVSHPPDFLPEKFEAGSDTGDAVRGPGAVDMKGGLAVMLEIARQLSVKNQTKESNPPFDLSLIFYASEEVEIEKSGLRHIEKENPELLAGDAGILMEPTGGAIEAGCQGSMKVRLTLTGRRAHTARAWRGENAIHRLGRVLAAAEKYKPRKPVIDSCKFHEALQAVSVSGGVAGNVVPDVAEAVFNLRIAPDKTNDQALDELLHLVETALYSRKGTGRDKGSGANSKTGRIEILRKGTPEEISPSSSGGDTGGNAGKADYMEVLDDVPSAAPSLSHPLLAALVDKVETVRAKLGWTDVSFFYERGIPALNFGPGDSELAHTQQEEVSGAELASVFQKLMQMLQAE